LAHELFQLQQDPTARNSVTATDMRLFSKRSPAAIKPSNKTPPRLTAVPAPPFSRMRQLHGLSRRLLLNSDLDSMARALFDATGDVPGVKTITLRLSNQTTGVFEPVACHDLDQAEWRLAAPLGGLGLSRTVIKNKQMVTFNDLQNHPNIQSPSLLKKYGLVSYLGIPLLSANIVTGVVGFYSGSSRGFDQEDIEYLTLASDLFALAIEKTRYPGHRTVETTPLPRSAGSEHAREEFLNVMSHEFRTPLSLIMGHAGMMREGLLGEINEEQRNSLDRIMENSDSLLSMVLSILQVSRIESGGINLVARSIVLRDIFAELQSDYAGQVNERRKIVWYCPPDLPLLRADRERLRDILRHLIDNAVKFTAHGRIVISAEQVSEPASIRITVSDTGVGIPTEALSFIFDKFRQSDSSGTRAFDGAGLGLYIAKKYADLLGGELTVISEVGYGSTFTLKLPLGT
jgi:signal transduction histidine kinase